MLDVVWRPNAEKALEARRLLSLLDFKFVFFLHLFCDILGKTQLQSSSVDFSAAADVHVGYM